MNTLFAHTEPLLTCIASQLIERRQFLCTAESCTGGLLAAACTEIAGSSQWFERGFVTYSNAAKHESIHVPHTLIEQFGAVSEETVTAMASGALRQSHAHWSIAVTGIAGPTGGTPQKPVGLVWCGFAWRASLSEHNPLFTHTEPQIFHGNRHEIRQATVKHVLNVLLKLMDETQITR